MPHQTRLKFKTILLSADKLKIKFQTKYIKEVLLIKNIFWNLYAEEKWGI